MADNQSTVSHLTQLDFDISGVYTSLEKTQDLLAKTAAEIANDPKYKIKFETENAEQQKNVNANLQSQITKLQELASEYGNLSKAKATFSDAEATKMTSAQIQMEDSLFNKKTINYKMEEAELKVRSVTIESNSKKVEQAYNKEAESLDKIIAKQKELIATVQSQPTSKENRAILQEATANLENLNKVKQATATTKVFTDADRQNVSDYSAKVKELNTSFKATGNGANNFLKTITDKARWLAAFYLINQLRQTFVSSIEIIKDTEEAVVELQRVLNEDISQTALSDELYKIAQDYGRTFAEVSETAVKFAQTGATWNDTLKLTESTMLAVNTAELSVNTATSGLIAVISQFNLDAIDMADVINKINITADNFAVTSEKIVAALQRAGASAVNANLDLEQTIALITTLSKATGRSGENIGTALNSLLIYTSKTKSLDVFAGLSDNMDTLVEKYKSGSASIVEVWQGLSETIQSLSSQQQQALEQSLLSDEDFGNFVTAFEEEASDISQTIKDTYSTAGTFRQNYFISLLKNIDTYDEAMATMAQAEGYSLSENEKAMSTLTRQWESLKTAAAELAVQFGEMGALDFLKSLVNLGKGVVSLTKYTGGLTTTFWALSAVFLAIKREQIADKFAKIGQSLKLVKSGADAASVAGLKLQTAFGWISLVLGAIALLRGAIQGAISANEALAQSAIDSANSYADENKEIRSLVDEYNGIVSITDDAAKKTEELDAFKKKLIETYGYEKEAVEALNGAREDEINFLNEEYTQNVKKAYASVYDEYEKARKKIEESDTKFSLSDAFTIGEKTLNILEQTFDVTREITDTMSGASELVFDFDSSNLYEYRDALADVIGKTKNNEAVQKALTAEYDRVNKIIDKNSEAYSIGTKTLTEHAIAVEYLDEIQGVSSQETYDELIAQIKEETASLVLQDAIISELAALFPEYSEKVQEAAESNENLSNSANAITVNLEDLKNAASDLTSEMDNVKSSFETIFDVMNEYNSTGVMTYDMLQQIMSLDGEYAALLNVTADGISLNADATNNLLSSKRALAEQTIATQAATQIATLAESLYAEQLAANGQAEANAVTTSSWLVSSIADVINAAANGTVAMQAFTSSIAAYAGQVGLTGNFASRFNQGAKQILNNAKQMAAALGSLGTGGGGSGGGGGTDDSYRKELEAQKKAIKEKYQAEIDGLKAVEKENDRIRRKEEYQRNQDKNARDLAQAQARSGIEYREKEYDIQEDINDEERKWQEQQQDWAIDDRIKELEAMRDAEIAVIDAQLSAIQSAGSSAVSSAGFSMGAIADLAATTISNDILDPVSGDFDELGNKATETTDGVAEEATDKVKETAEESEQIVDEATQKILDQAELTAKMIADIYDESLIVPTKTAFEGIFGFTLVSTAQDVAKQMYTAFSVNFVSKLRRDINNLFADTATGFKSILPSNYSNGSTPTQMSYTTNSPNYNIVANSSSSNSYSLQNQLNKIIGNRRI